MLIHIMASTALSFLSYSTHVWIVDPADHIFRPIEDEKRGEVGSVTGHNDHRKPGPHHTEHTRAETPRGTWALQVKAREIKSRQTTQTPNHYDGGSVTDVTQDRYPPERGVNKGAKFYEEGEGLGE